MTDAEVEQTLREAREEKQFMLNAARHRRTERLSKGKKAIGIIAAGFLCYLALVGFGALCDGTEHAQLIFSVTYFSAFHPWALLIVVLSGAVLWAFKK